jgi:hypothetical protein
VIRQTPCRPSYGGWGSSRAFVTNGQTPPVKNSTSASRETVFRMDTTRQANRITVAARLDPVDLAALEAEQARRARAGVVADRSALLREAVRIAFGGEKR